MAWTSAQTIDARRLATEYQQLSFLETETPRFPERALLPRSTETGGLVLIARDFPGLGSG
jgi:hypothetical protein